MACHPRLRLGRQTIFPDPPESLESNSITCHPLDQSLFVYCGAFGPTGIQDSHENGLSPEANPQPPESLESNSIYNVIIVWTVS